jgi:hypothetical protein
MIPDPNLVAPILLQLFNGSEALLLGIFLLWALRYLWLETKRRGLHWTDWFMMRLPPPMALVVAILVNDSANWLRSIVIWDWRTFGKAGDFTRMQLFLLAIAGLVAITGVLCKIRAVTKPDYGNEPWLICLALVLIFVVISLILLV